MIYNIESLGKAIGKDYFQVYKMVQKLPDLGFLVGKRRYFTEEDMKKMTECVENYNTKNGVSKN